MFTKFHSTAGQQFTYALEEDRVHVRAIENNQAEIMEVLRRIELNVYHRPATPPAPTNFLLMAPNILPVARNTSLSVAPNSSLPVVPTTLLPVVPKTCLPVAHTASLSVAPNSSLPVAPNTPLPMLPIYPLPVARATPLPLFGTRDSPAEPCLVLDTTSTNHPEPFVLNHTYVNFSLPSDEIPRDSLNCIQDSLKGCEELKCVEKASTLTQSLIEGPFWRGSYVAVQSRRNKGLTSST